MIIITDGPGLEIGKDPSPNEVITGDLTGAKEDVTMMEDLIGVMEDVTMI